MKASAAANQYLAASEKARLPWKLEAELKAFENPY